MNNLQTIIILLQAALSLLRVAPHDPNTLALVNSAMSLGEQTVESFTLNTGVNTNPIVIPVSTSTLPTLLFGTGTDVIEVCPSPSDVARWNSFAANYINGALPPNNGGRGTWLTANEALMGGTITRDDAELCGMTLIPGVEYY